MNIPQYQPRAISNWCEKLTISQNNIPRSPGLGVTTSQCLNISSSRNKQELFWWQFNCLLRLSAWQTADGVGVLILLRQLKLDQLAWAFEARSEQIESDWPRE